MLPAFDVTIASVLPVPFPAVELWLPPELLSVSSRVDVKASVLVVPEGELVDNVVAPLETSKLKLYDEARRLRLRRARDDATVKENANCAESSKAASRRPKTSSNR